MPITTKSKPEAETARLPGEAPASMGHNRPPLDEQVKAEFREELLRDHPQFMDTYSALIAAAERATATDDETLGKCGDLVRRCRALITHINDTHKLVKQPYLDGGRAADAEKNALIVDVEAAKRTVEGVGNAFVAKRDAERRAEQERIAAEQRKAAEAAAAAEREAERAEQARIEAQRNAANDEERRAAEEAADAAAIAAEEAMSAAALAPAAATTPEPVRSDAGAVVSGKKEWKSEVTDYETAFIAADLANDENVRDAIDKAIARRVRAGTREIAGCRIWPVAKANFR
ncbi:hypothetical protein [Caenibius sp. WL]|uniref:hypothetical protein n=1 Tax=Caenibius sp. WL TaxID=2872646 RepID=UPI001C99C79E|nr:hypothetical protein [Caenibius sp. WL]QZP06836.1 hypothetical protein K5X80_08850 [Caenibius sp. WL]